MTASATTAAHLAAQLLVGSTATTPEAVTGHLLAVQAQDPRGARLSIRSRTRGLTAADVDRALTDDRSLVVSWLNRGTLHLVCSEDLAWLHALTAPTTLTANARRLAQEGVTADAADRGVEVIERSLTSDGPLTRADLRDRLDAAGIRTEGQALVHVLVLASLRGLVVRGPMVGSQQAFVLVRDWLGTQPAVDRDVALAELARRYLVGHGPATDRDLARWSGLGLRDARAGLRAIAGELDEASDGSVDLTGRRPVAELPPPKLLGPFDPLLLGWVSRDDDRRQPPLDHHDQRPLPAVRAGRRQGRRHLVAGGRPPRAGPLRPPLEGHASGPRCGRRRRAPLPRRGRCRSPRRGVCVGFAAVGKEATLVNETSDDVVLVDISKRFGAVTAVERVNLSVRAGEFFSLLGPSGSGKTTCLRMIAGFEQPTSGRILLQGRDVAGLPAYDRDVNTVFQDYALFPHLSVGDNVAYGLKVKGVGRAERQARAAEALAMVRLPDFGKRRINQLSGGQRQRVALARALVNRPRVLLLDEPLGALDLKLREEMQVELKRIQGEVSITFIYVTHDQDEALSMSDRLAVFSNGRIEQVGTPAEVYESPGVGVRGRLRGHVEHPRGRPGRAPAWRARRVHGATREGLTPGRRRRAGRRCGRDPCHRVGRVHAVPRRPHALRRRPRRRRARRGRRAEQLQPRRPTGPRPRQRRAPGVGPPLRPAAPGHDRR